MLIRFSKNTNGSVSGVNMTLSIIRTDYLINNAGVLVPKRKEIVGFDGTNIELMLQVNHLAPFALCLKLLPLLR